MANIIKPKEFLTQLKNSGSPAPLINPSDLLEIAELNITIPLSKALKTIEFYDMLKKAVSDFNSDAALNGNLSVDFDDLYTRYSEYIAVMEYFSQEPNSS